MSNSMLAAVNAAAGEDAPANARVIDASAAQIAQARAEGVAEGEKKGAASVAEAVKAERVRCAAILGSDAAKGREEMARFCAFETDMSAEQAAAMLGKAPAQASNQSPLDRVMANAAPPVRAEPPGAQAQPVAIDTMGIYAARAATVSKFNH